MKKLYALAFTLSLFRFAFSQCTILPNAVQGISYTYVQGGGTNASGVAYNPNLNIYYAAIAGNPGFPYETFDASGVSLFQTNAGFDFRGLWWNPNTNEVEGNGYFNLGLWTSNLNGTGYALNTGTNIYTGQNQPDAQSCGDYDCQADEIVYYFNGKIYRYARTNGALLGNYNLTGCPVPVGNWNTTSVVYTGCAGNEIGIEDYVAKNILLFNKATGAYSGMSALPAAAVTNNSFRFSYANNLVWLYDAGPARKWTSYSIFSGTPNGGAVVNLGSDTTLCTGQTLTLDAQNAGATFLWQDGSTNQTLNVTTTGIYYVSVNAGGCYFSHDTIKVTFNSGSLTVNLGNDTTVCNGQPITLDATTAGATYLWSTAATSNTISANSSGTYWVKVSAGGCSARDTMILSLSNPVAVNVSVSICPNSTYTLPDGSIVSTAGIYIDTLVAVSGCNSIITTNLSIASFSIDAGNDTAICNGHSTQLNATGALIYTWTPTTNLSDPNIANPIATPTTTTTYTVSSQAPIGNLIANGDFAAGNTGFSSNYVYTTNNTTEGQFYVGPNAAAWNGGMASCGDHTTGSGSMLCVNGATTANVSIYCQTVNVLPNTTYAFSTWLMTLTAGNPAQLQFSINGSLLGAVFTATNGTCNWQQFYTTWNSGANTSATICIVNQNTIASANDFALDDILFAPLCTGIDSVTITVYPTYSNTVNATICQNQNYTLPDGTATNTAGIYVDTLPTVNGCDSIITTNLTVNPTFAYSVTQTICPSDLYILPSGTIVNTTGIYVDTLSTVNGCDSIITTNLTVVPPSIIVSNDTQVCLGSAVQLNASGGLLSYAWTPTTDLSDPNISNPVATPTQTRNYIVTTQVASGDLIGNGDFEGGNAGFSSAYAYQSDLTPAATYYVGANPNTYHPGFSACVDHTSGTGNLMIVNGAGTPNTNVWCETINVVPNTNYAFGAWVTSVSAGSPAILQFEINGVLLSVPFNAPGTVCTWQQFYALWNSGVNTTANICIINQNTTSGGNDFAIDDISFIGLCDVRDTITITVHNPSQTNIDKAICQGTTYTFPSGVTSIISVIDTSLLFDGFGCDSVIITNLTVHPSYAVSVFDTICQGTSYTLPLGTVVNSTGVYVDSLATTFGCDSVITTNLFVTPPPVTDVFDSICSNQTYTLPGGIIVSTAGNYTDTLNTIAGCDSVVITHLFIKPSSAVTVLDTTCNGLSFILPDGSSVSITGIYPVTLINQFGCDSVVTTILTVIQVTLNSSNTDELCNGGNTAGIISLASVGVLPYNYDLLFGGSVIANNASGNFTSLVAGNYSVNITDAFGCTANSSLTINEPTPLLLSDSVSNVHCFGEANGEVLIIATGGTPAYAFNLNNQSLNTNGSFTSLNAGTYDYTVTDANGCADSSTAVVTEPQAVIINLNPDSVVINLGASIQLNASSNYDPSTTYLWTPNFGLSCYTCPNPVVESNYSVHYRLEVTATINGNDCYAEMNVPVTVIPNYDIFIPNVFTPNGDGNNDFFQIFGNMPALKFIEVEIYDRWGEKVFESNDLHFKWDGTYKGKMLEPTVLVYTLHAGFIDNHSEKIYKGTLTLLK